ncbi:ABC transporter permease [Anaerosphaera multitolerans]|uniref:ABC transporter permease n=1 Tax=Anaerosphaera multitolerans TaxID=2487351 RepID=A0A437S9J3_9FIRM|nr:FtsX-like permease family protein [Anaerosphaera multitolerans]RVU55487.1 ABC transporter permease [Anaerosphaera multitolerans]
MKSYLDLVKISAKENKRKYRMTIICIVLAVFLVSSIFGMAEMEIRSQKMQITKDAGNWHYGFEINREDAEMIGLRPEIKVSGWYSQINANQGYTLRDTGVAIVGMDEGPFNEIFKIEILEGTYPKAEREILLSENAKRDLKLSLGDEVTLKSPSGEELNFKVSGFSEGNSRILAEGHIGAFLTDSSYGKNITEGNDFSSFLVRFSPYSNMSKILGEIKADYGISSEQVMSNSKLLGVLGQSRMSYMMQLYYIAFILFILVMLAGILMIASSLNSNVIQRVEFFGMMRCLGATEKQVMKFVRREALSWCKVGIPIGIALSVVVVWILCAILRFASPHYFAELPVFGVSLVGVVFGAIVGILTVLLAAQSPAKKASKVSPLAAVSGNANGIKAVKKAANTKVLKVEWALGIEHAKSSKKNFLLMVSSFALSIVLFLGFSVMIDFMDHGVQPLQPYAPDFTIEAEDILISRDKAEKIRGKDGVKFSYKTMTMDSIEGESKGENFKLNLISHDEAQFNWAKENLLEGSMEDVKKGEGVLIVKDSLYNNSVEMGDIININLEGEIKSVEVVGILSTSPYMNLGNLNVVTSEETFENLTGQSDYSTLYLQFEKDITEEDIEEIKAFAGSEFNYGDMRMGNKEVRGIYYSFALFVYGFIAVIALITVFNISNSVSMSVSANMKQYGFMRAIGMNDEQLVKMILAETLTYSIAGAAVGCLIGIPLNRFIFNGMVTSYWGAQWTVPIFEIVIILVLVIVTSIIAVYSPTKRIKNMSIVETIRSN